MKITDYLKKDGNKSYLKVKVVPNSTKTEFFQVMDDMTLKIRLKQEPQAGKANKELISFISQELWIEREKIKLLSWASSRTKILRIDF